MAEITAAKMMHDREAGAPVVVAVRTVIVVHVRRTAVVGVADIEAAPVSLVGGRTYRIAPVYRSMTGAP